MSIDLFQSTLPRRERREDRLVGVWKAMISIHAPAKGATKNAFEMYLDSVDFNPRSREGATA